MLLVAVQTDHSASRLALGARLPSAVSVWEAVGAVEAQSQHSQNCPETASATAAKRHKHGLPHLAQPPQARFTRERSQVRNPPRPYGNRSVVAHGQPVAPRRRFTWASSRARAWQMRWRHTGWLNEPARLSHRHRRSPPAVRRRRCPAPVGLPRAPRGRSPDVFAIAARNPGPGRTMHRSAARWGARCTGDRRTGRWAGCTHHGFARHRPYGSRLPRPTSAMSIDRLCGCAAQGRRCLEHLTPDELESSSTWPAGSRVIVRRECAHPGAQLAFAHHDGHRFQATLTDQPDADLPTIDSSARVAASGACRALERLVLRVPRRRPWPFQLAVRTARMRLNGTTSCLQEGIPGFRLRRIFIATSAEAIGPVQCSPVGPSR
jgi:hypothetical protein